MATNPFTPSTIPQAGNITLVSNVDLAQPIWSPTLYQPYGTQGAEVMQFFKAMGALVPVIRMTGVHWEEDRYGSAFQVKTLVSAPGAGSNLTIQLASAYIDATTRESWPIENEIVKSTRTGKQYQIISKTDNGSDTTLVLRPLKSTTNESAQANEYFMISGVSVAEASDKQDTKNSYQTEYTWQLQDIRTDHNITGSDFTESLQPVRYEKGGAIVGYNSIATVQHEYDHLQKTVNTMIWGETATNTSMPGVGYTTGMVEQFELRAVNQDTGGSLTVADFESIEQTLSSNWALGNYITLLSGKSYSEISADVISDFNQSNINAVNNQLANALFGTSGFDVNQLYATYSVQGLAVNGKSFGLKRLTILDDPNGAAANNSALQDYGFVLPIGKTRDNDGVPRGFVELKYKDFAGQNRMMRMWYTGGASPAKNTSKDDFNMHIVSEIGFDFMNLQQCALFKNSALS
jgi:hypothetical protein